MGIEMKVVVKESGLDDIVERLKHAYDPERIYLFGSRARGDEALTVISISWSWSRMTHQGRGGEVASPIKPFEEREWLRTSWCGPAPTSRAAAI